MKSLFIIISLIHFALGEVTGQTLSHPETGLPFIQNYPPQITGGDAQNWQILQDKRGLIYSVNNYGILQYDGQSWRIIPAPNNSRIRALAIDHRGIIYFKAESDFGYLAPDSTGTLRAVSLIPKLKATHRGKGLFYFFLEYFALDEQAVSNLERQISIPESIYCNKCPLYPAGWPFASDAGRFHPNTARGTLI